jgi:hypothetical protein
VGNTINNVSKKGGSMKKKTCRVCKEIKLLRHFNVHQAAKDGRRTYCKPCATILMRNYRKVGKTTMNEFSHKSLSRLNSIFNNLKEAFSEHGITLKKMSK